MPKITIVGAGVAGMAAAAELCDAGWQVRMLDKASAAGGRCATRHIELHRARAWFDYGAQYFTARDPVFQALVAQDLAAGRLREWTPTVARAERIGQAWLLAPSPDDRQRLIGPTGLRHWVRERLSLYPVDIDLQARVHAISRTRSGWHIEREDGTQEDCEVLLLTVPAVQARALLPEDAADIPCLAQADTIQSACHSLVVRAPGLSAAQAIFISDGNLSWAADNSHKAQRVDGDGHIWTLHASPAFSDALVETETLHVAPRLMEEFAAITGQAGDTIELMRAHRWRYARPGPDAPDADALCWCNARSDLALAGDWLAGGRVEGAWRSGRAAARHLIDAA